jgi:uncharacterized protein (TIGR01732 family)
MRQKKIRRSLPMGYGFGGYDCGCHGGYGQGYGFRSGFALIVVLFILLIIIGATVYNRN